MKQWSSEGFYLVSVAEARGWEKGSPLMAEVRAGGSQLHPFDIWGRIILCWEERMFLCVFSRIFCGIHDLYH